MTAKPDFTFHPLLEKVRQEWRNVLTDTSSIDRDRAAPIAQALCLPGGQSLHTVQFFPSPMAVLQALADLPIWQVNGFALCELASLRRKELFDVFEAQLTEDLQGHIAEELYCNLNWLRPGAYLSNLNRNLVMNGAGPATPPEPVLLGGLDAYWLGAYDFAQRAGFLQLSPPLDTWFAAYKLYAQECGWMFLRADTVLVCDRPLTVCLDHNGRLHSPHGPALSWSDGSGIYAWYGCLIPHWAIEDPARLNADSVAAERDPQVRRALFEIWAGGDVEARS